MKTAITDGTLHPDKLIAMDSGQRRDLFAKIIGEDNAREVNLAFEQKLVLKNQEQAMVNWARDTLGLSAEAKEATAAKIKATYAEKKRRVFTPEEDEAFLNEITSDVFSKKYKTEVSLEEAQKITELSRDVSIAHEKMNGDFTWGDGSEKDRLKYGIDFGVKKVLMDRYIGGLKSEAEKRSLLNPLKEKSMGNVASAIGEDIEMAAQFIADNTRAIQASFDNSFWGRQGFKAMTNPKYTKLWVENFTKSFQDIGQVLSAGVKKGELFKGAAMLKKQAIIDAVKADIYSRPNYLNGNYDLGTKLAIGVREEDIPTSVPEKIPLLGRLFSASDVAYEAGAMRLRADIADKLYKIAENQKVNLDDKFEVGSINEIVNSLTGRGNLNAWLTENGQKALNVTFFSPKNVKSNIDFLTAHAGQNVSKFAKKQAGQNLMSTLGVMGVVLGLANTLWPDSVELDPRSSDFGKIKIGNTRFDVSGGLASYMVLLGRMWTGETKSTLTGLITKKGEEFGSGSKMDFLWDFTENKFSPVASLLKTLWLKEDFKGEPITKVDALIQSVIPIPLGSAYETFKDPNSAPLLLALLADSIGFGASTFGTKMTEAEKTFEQIMSLPEAERRTAIQELKASNPDFYKEVQQAEREDALGITPLDKAVLKMGVEDGERAMYIAEQVEKLATAQEKNSYINSLKEKGIINMDETGPTIIDQLKEIRDAGGLKEYSKKKAASEAELINKAKNATGVESMAELVKLYVQAFGSDPLSAIQTLFTTEQLKDVRGGAVIMERMGVETSEAIKRKGGAGPTDRLDHIVPLELGGDNSMSNLKIVTFDEWNSYTKTENYLGDLLNEGKVTEQEAKSAIIAFKNKELTSEEVKSKYQ